MLNIKQWLARKFIIDNFGDVVDVLASDQSLRQGLEAKVSCRMLQHGSHIDSLPIEPPILPSDNKKAIATEQDILEIMSNE